MHGQNQNSFRLPRLHETPALLLVSQLAVNEEPLPAPEKQVPIVLDCNLVACVAARPFLGWHGRSERASAPLLILSALDFDDSPDIFVAGPDLGDARQVTETNPFHGDYAWGHSELIDYTTDRGRRMQGALYFPADYQPGQQ